MSYKFIRRGIESLACWCRFAAAFGDNMFVHLKLEIAHGCHQMMMMMVISRSVFALDNSIIILFYSFG